MLFQVYTENGVKKIKYLTADTGTGAPVGSYLMLEKKSNPQGYLYCDGSTFDSTAYPALYQYLGTNVLPDWREFSPVGAEQNTTNVYDASTNPSGVIHDHDVYTEGEAKAVFVYIKATSGLTENQQENVLNTINDNLSYSTTEHPTGKKWIDGKDIYSKVMTITVIQSNLQSPQNFSHGITGLDKIVNYFGNCEITNVKRPFPYTDPTSMCNLNSWNNTDIYLFCGYQVINLELTIEYTKTT